MRKLPIRACLVLLCLAGCQKPAPLTVEPPPETPAGSLTVTVLPSTDTSITVNPIDSVGVLPTEQVNYNGFFLVNNVKYDNGHGVFSTAYASAYFGDRTRPLIVNGKTLGYFGKDLMPFSAYPLRIGGIYMARFPYRIHIGSRDSTFGSIYRAAFASFQPHKEIDWDDPGDDTTTTRPFFRDTVVTPEDLQVLSPVGGSVFSRTKPIELRWTGGGKIAIVISSVNPLTGKTRPILLLQPAVNAGNAVVEPLLLQQLLPQTRFFVFTFIIANRTDKQLGVLLQDRTLVQASSVYNSYFQLQ